MAHEAAIQQKKQDDCNARLNAVSSPDAMKNAFERLANADRCRDNPNITPEEAALLKPGEVLDATVPPQHDPNDLAIAKALGRDPQPQRGTPQPIHPKAIEGTVTYHLQIGFR